MKSTHKHHASMQVKRDAAQSRDPNNETFAIKLSALGWTREKAAEQLNKSTKTIDSWLARPYQVSYRRMPNSDLKLFELIFELETAEEV